MLVMKSMDSMGSIIRERRTRACKDLLVVLGHFEHPEIAEVLGYPPGCSIRGLDSQIEQFLTTLESRGWDLAQKRRREVGENGK